MYVFANFACWSNVLHFVDNNAGQLWYKAPLDAMAYPVIVKRRFKNGKLRLRYHDVTFTADHGHLDRMRYQAEEG